MIGQLHLGGAERQLYELAVRVDRRRFDPRVICLSGVTEPFAGRLRGRGVPVDVVERAGHVDLGRAMGLARILRARRIELVHSFLLAANTYVYAARLLLGLRGRRPAFIASSRVCSPAAGAWTMLLHRRAFRAASAVIANSRVVKDHTSDLFRLEEGRIRVIYNGIPIEDTVPVPEGVEPLRSEVRRELGIPAGAVLVATLSRLAPQKDPGLFLDLAARIVSAGEESDRVRFAVVGTGPLERELRGDAAARGLDDRVRFVGAREDIHRIMTAIDVFVLTSRFEGLPNAVMEAMAAGLPVVATRAHGTGELVVDGETGYLVPTGDAAALVERVRRLCSDPGLRDGMGRRGRARIASSFTVETMVARTMSLYEEVLA